MIAINISDVYTTGKGGKTWKEITNPMCDFLIHKGLKYRGVVIGMEMIQRPNSGGVEL